MSVDGAGARLNPLVVGVFGVEDYDRERGLTDEQLVTLGKSIAIIQIGIDA